MVNKYLNNMLVQMSKILGCEVGLIEGGGNVAGSGDTSTIASQIPEIFESCMATRRKTARIGEYTYYAVVTRGRPDYVSFVKCTDENAEKYAEMLSISIGSMRQMHNDKYDKTNFIKNILSDSILPGDIFLKSKEMHMAYDIDRVVFALQYEDVRGIDVYDIVNSLFPENSKDFVIDLDNSIIVLVREIRTGLDKNKLDKVAQEVVDTINMEAMVNIRVGIGTVARNLKDVAKSYKEARIALEVGKVFDGDKNIISYDNLGIARLIYQLPTTLCELYLSEIFKKDSIDMLDSETLYTIQKFFENNLNVSETSRQLYVHRNTLVYRLDKVRKMTGLDLRLFDHAIVFKVALMVKKYLVSKPTRI